MSMKLNKPAYQRLIDEDKKWLTDLAEKAGEIQWACGELDHILTLLDSSVDWYYPERVKKVENNEKE